MKYFAWYTLASISLISAATKPLERIISSKQTPGTVQILSRSYAQTTFIDASAVTDDAVFTFATPEELDELEGYATTQSHKKVYSTTLPVIKHLRSYFKQHLDELATHKYNADSACHCLIQTNNPAHTTLVEIEFKKRPGGFIAAVTFVCTSPEVYRPEAIINLVTAMLVDNSTSTLGKVVKVGAVCIVTGLCILAATPDGSTPPPNQPRRNDSQSPSMAEIPRTQMLLALKQFRALEATFTAWLTQKFGMNLEKLKTDVSDHSYDIVSPQPQSKRDLYAIFFNHIPQVNGHVRLLDTYCSNPVKGLEHLVFNQMKSVTTSSQDALTSLITYINTYDTDKACKTQLQKEVAGNPELQAVLNRLT